MASLWAGSYRNLVVYNIDDYVAGSLTV